MKRWRSHFSGMHPGLFRHRRRELVEMGVV
nr:MAG TPA: hypothetical protein [Caudoviricetes sp.]